jgi:two-component system OmpR family response regulator
VTVGYNLLAASLAGLGKNSGMSNVDSILIVDDDAEIRHLLRDYLAKHGLRATAVADGKGMWQALEQGRFDLIVLDLMLPGEDGLTLCRNLRVRANLPVVMLTALGEETDRIIGLEMGADDYLAKPFNPRELLARVKAVLRRTRSLPDRHDGEQVTRIYFADWTLDLSSRNLISPEGNVVTLSGGEYRLLQVFLDHPNRVLSRDQLLDFTQGREGGPFERSIDMQVGRLRRRLRDDAKEPQIIKTVRSAGYVLATPVRREP